jgi:hypothetical protein
MSNPVILCAIAIGATVEGLAYGRETLYKPKYETPSAIILEEALAFSVHLRNKEPSMSEERPQNTESNESGLLLSVDPISSERSLDFGALSDDNKNAPADTDAEDNVGDADGTDDTDATDISADDADGTD